MKTPNDQIPTTPTPASFIVTDSIGSTFTQIEPGLFERDDGWRVRLTADAPTPTPDGAGTSVPVKSEAFIRLEEFALKCRRRDADTIIHHQAAQLGNDISEMLVIYAGYSNAHPHLAAQNAELRRALIALIHSGDNIAAHFDPGPIPAPEPTQRDEDFGNWEYDRNQARAALAKATEGKTT